MQKGVEVEGNLSLGRGGRRLKGFSAAALALALMVSALIWSGLCCAALSLKLRSGEDTGFVSVSLQWLH